MKIEHIAMYVNDLEAARNFFVNYLGAVSNDGYHNQTTDFRSYFLTFDDGVRPRGVQRRQPGEGGRADGPSESGWFPGGQRPQNHWGWVL